MSNHPAEISPSCLGYHNEHSKNPWAAAKVSVHDSTLRKNGIHGRLARKTQANTKTCLRIAA